MMLCLGGGPGLAGCGTATDAVDGPRVFASMCATCHGDRGKPSEAMAARLGVRDLTAAEFRARVTPALVEKQVRGGSANKLMPAFAGALSEAQIASVAGYVADAGFVR
jgi:mono/diheme cytochrome c family protein